MNKWTKFMDMYSGGGLKEDQQYIYIEAPLKEAVIIFYNKFGHNPYRVTCTCCGEDYSIDEEDSLEQATAYNRGCKFVDNRYIEEWNGNSWSKYQTLEEYFKNKDVLIIRANEIKPEERIGEVPQQGYVWME